MDNYIDSNSNINNNIENDNNTNLFICQDQNIEDCCECENKNNCNFWNNDFEEDLDDYKWCWYEMSYRKFIDRAIEFQHSELQ